MLKKVFARFFQDKTLLLILITALAIRVIYLNKLPPGIVHDELNYVMNAKSLFYTGKNIPLTASAILSWGEKNYDVVISELPSYLIMFWIGLTRLSFFTARFPYAIVSSMSVVVLYLITKNLLGKNIAKYAGFVMAFNPWSIHLGRTALEVNFALFFFLLGAYVILIVPPKNILRAFPFFLVMFFSYLGAKLHFFPLVLVFLVYKYITSKESPKQKRVFMIFAALSLVLLLSYVFTLDYQPSGTRRVELILFERDWAASLVNKERLRAIPNAGLELFSNKATVILRRIVDVYLKAFSSIGLFTRGETVSVYSIWEYGQFHYIDFFLIIMGLVALFSLSSQVFWLLVAIILLSPTVSSIELVEQSYAIRAYPMFPMFCLLSGAGIWYLKEKFKFGKLVFLAIGAIYLSSVVYFLNLYIYRYPVYAAERWFLSERILANYARHALENSGVKKVIISPIESQKIVFEEFLFFSGLYENSENIVKINKNIEKHDFSYDKVSFIKGCPGSLDFDEEVVLITHANYKCSEEKPGKRGIVDLKDAGTVYYIDNDILCKDYELARYYRPMDLFVFDMEKQSIAEFCKNWIISF